MDAVPPPRRTSSDRRLVLFLGGVVLVPLTLVFGPFRGHFFRSDAPAIAALAEPPDDGAVLAALADWMPAALRRELGDRFEQALAARDWVAVAVALERVEPMQATAAVRHLHGLLLLRLDRPAPALAGFHDAATLAADSELVAAARHARAQALLLLGHAASARVELSALAAGGGRHAEPAQRQLARLQALE